MHRRALASFCLVVVLFGLVSAAPAAQAADDCTARMLAYTAKCKTELKLTDDDVAGFAKPPFALNGTKCLIKCVAENFAVLTKDTKIDEAAVTTMINQFSKNNTARRDKALGLMNTCKNISGSDPCDIAAKMYMCVMDGAKKVNLGMD